MPGLRHRKPTVRYESSSDDDSEASPKLVHAVVAAGTAWHPDEDAALITAVNKVGRRWKDVEREMAKLGTGRSQAMCRNRFLRIRAPLTGATCKNRCKRCGAMKRGHTCGDSPRLVTDGLGLTSPDGKNSPGTPRGGWYPAAKWPPAPSTDLLAHERLSPEPWGRDSPASDAAAAAAATAAGGWAARGAAAIGRAASQAALPRGEAACGGSRGTV